MAYQYEFPFQVRRTLRLDDVERILTESGAMSKSLSRPKLIELIDDGTLEGKKLPGSNFYVVYEDSFIQWVKSFAAAMPLAA